jgi:signal transduction histidine kinase
MKDVTTPPDRRSRLATLAFAVATVLVVAGVGLEGWGESVQATESTWGAGGVIPNLVFVVLMYGFAVIGFMVVRRDPENRIGWLLLLIGGVWSLDAALSGYYVYALRVAPGSLPAPRIAASVEAAMWVPAIALMGFHLLILFPDGRLPTKRSRLLFRVANIAMAVAFVAILFRPGELEDASIPHLVNPLGIDALAGVLDVLTIAIVAVPLAVIGAAVVMIGRYRRSSGVERLQLKWFAFATALVAVTYLCATAASLPSSFTDRPDPSWAGWVQSAALFSFGFIPIAVGVAVLKYRLFEIDVIISKTLVFGLLAGFITLVYIGIVVGIGRLIGSSAGAGLQIAATAVVALLFQPVRDRVRRFANRLVYGSRATPYQVMAELSRRMSSTLEIERAMPELAETAAAGVAAAAVQVRLFLPDGAERTAVAPPGAEIPERWDATIEVRHQGEPIGEIDVAKAPSDPLRPAESSLLDDLAAQAGLALHNVRLTDELTARAEELAETAAAVQRSRRRIVSVRDEQRRRLEREIREGPRSRLDAIGTELGLLADRVAAQPDAAAAELDRLSEETNVTLDRLRGIARGIFPPLLSDQGAAAALEAHARKVGVNATLAISPSVSSVRFDPEIEACVYFCCLQAIQNVQRHAGNAPIVVELSAKEGALSFEVRDAGPGFDTTTTREGTGTTIMRDRVEALDGTLEIESAPGSGTTVRGRIPIPVGVT